MRFCVYILITVWFFFSSSIPVSGCMYTNLIIENKRFIVQSPSRSVWRCRCANSIVFPARAYTYTYRDKKKKKTYIIRLYVQSVWYNPTVEPFDKFTARKLRPIKTASSSSPATFFFFPFRYHAAPLIVQFYASGNRGCRVFEIDCRKTHFAESSAVGTYTYIYIGR